MKQVHDAYGLGCRARAWAQAQAPSEQTIPPPARVVIAAQAESQIAPHGRGNVYAPEILRSGKQNLRLWFGGQGRDGHDRIHLAVSTNGGIRWEQRGVAFDDPTANHCNDPSVVVANGVLYLFYTRAGAGVTDSIALATSTDGVHWKRRGTVLSAGKPGAWDALSVGRPSVWFAGGVFHLWYDGRKDLPPDAPDPSAPKSNTSQRHVGYATSRDGFHWTRVGSAPVYDRDAGGVHVLRIGAGFAMLIESRAGTEAAISRDGIHWRSVGLLVARDGSPAERHGHVTPFLLPDPDRHGATLFYGAAAAATWDQNTIRQRRLTEKQWRLLHPSIDP